MNNADFLSPVAPPTLPCKCCGGEAVIYGVVDFNKRAEPGAHARQPRGIPIYYHRCPDCKFIFTAAFDHFTPAELSKWIYNEVYALLDGEYVEARPARNNGMLNDFFKFTRDMRILDYGCGNGALIRKLRESGFTSVDGYDPFVPEFAARPDGRYDMVTCFEVVEHSLRPAETFAELESFMKQDGIVIFSTLLQRPAIEAEGVGWWYVAPRNGHVSLFTPKAILKLTRPYGLQLASFTENMHVMYRDPPPPFARHLFP